VLQGKRFTSILIWKYTYGFAKSENKARVTDKGELNCGVACDMSVIMPWQKNSSLSSHANTLQRFQNMSDL
jgi:hypothetical protein